METYTELRELVENPDFRGQKRRALREIVPGEIDEPVRELVTAFNRLPCCFTLQICYGHFLFPGREDPHNLLSLPAEDCGPPEVEYRIAYLALGLENSKPGRELLRNLQGIPGLDPQNIQFFCADWFWERQLNSYALQVHPETFRDRDRAFLSIREARQIEKLRAGFFSRLEFLLKNLPVEIVGPVLA